MNNNFFLFGDSIGAGFCYDNILDRQFFLKDNFLHLFEKKTGIQTANYSVVGSTILDGWNLIKQYDEKIRQYTYIGLEFGGNDANFPWGRIAYTKAEDIPNITAYDQFIEIYGEILQKVSETGRTPVVFTLPPIDENRYINYVSKKLNVPQIHDFVRDPPFSLFQWHDMFNQAIERLAYEKHAILVDVRGSFLFKGENYKNFICYDGVHPNQEGHALICEAMQKTFDNYGLGKIRKDDTNYVEH